MVSVIAGFLILHQTLSQGTDRLCINVCGDHSGTAS